jgi:hypothetical protein
VDGGAQEGGLLHSSKERTATYIASHTAVSCHGWGPDGREPWRGQEQLWARSSKDHLKQSWLKHSLPEQSPD